ncbi:hypothetical protein Stube_14280 [Streptomyces tubercidicus]|uniref:Uncharacterized protein n=1 Tax=Streptomyces tubercidicus TaxID=47759 RepID=A0A640UR56_9ACTN|nr:hypothetical protein Stube_14280 [Streptomyces tubercidicus]
MECRGQLDESGGEDGAVQQETCEGKSGARGLAHQAEMTAAAISGATVSQTASATHSRSTQQCLDGSGERSGQVSDGGRMTVGARCGAMGVATVVQPGCGTE